MVNNARIIADAIKGVTSLLKLLIDWFYSDLDIEFVIKKGKRQLRCSFESDAYYFEGIRFGGNYRRFILWEGDDELYEELEHLTKKLYNKDELIELVEWLEDEYDVLFEKN